MTNYHRYLGNLEGVLNSQFTEMASRDTTTGSLGKLAYPANEAPSNEPFNKLAV
jgi:hypothetical protein